MKLAQGKSRRVINPAHGNYYTDYDQSSHLKVEIEMVNSFLIVPYFNKYGEYNISEIRAK